MASRTRELLATLLVVGLVTTGINACSDDEPSRDSTPVRIGVLLGRDADAAEVRRPLRWAAETVNTAGGVDGRRIELVFRAPNGDAATAAQDLGSDDSIAAVIDPGDTAEAELVVPVLVDAEKLVVVPTATSADLHRAYADADPQFVWRPIESDIAQVRVLLDLAVTGGASDVALVAGEGPYGNTFFQWFGFFATELGLHVTNTLRYDEDAESCEGPMAEALASTPTAVVAVPTGAGPAACMVRAWRAAGASTRLLLSDAARSTDLLEQLGPDAEGVEGAGPAPDPAGGFADGYRDRFGVEPGAYAANLYDAVLLVAFGSAAAGGAAGAPLADAVRAVVRGDDRPTTWDAAGVAATLEGLRRDEQPEIHGAVGPWRFDRQSGIELVASTYEHWRVEGGRFTTAGHHATSELSSVRAGASAARTTPAGRVPVLGSGSGAGSGVEPKTGTWALLVAASDGWKNYRHQADVLAQYQLLRDLGVPDDHLVLVLADDLADDERNPEPGTVRYTLDGPDVRRDAEIDYPLEGMTAERLVDILRGEQSEQNPAVIESGPGDDVYVYLAGHGNQNGVYLGLGDPTADAAGNYSIVAPDLLDGAVSALDEGDRYRRLLVAVEACQGGVYANGFDAPGALLITAANAVEDSLSANYDRDAGTWLADQFSYRLWTSIGDDPEQSIDALYRELYLGVAGSHVTVAGDDLEEFSGSSIGELLAP